MCKASWQPALQKRIARNGHRGKSAPEAWQFAQRRIGAPPEAWRRLPSARSTSPEEKGPQGSRATRDSLPHAGQRRKAIRISRTVARTRGVRSPSGVYTAYRRSSIVR